MGTVGSLLVRLTRRDLSWVPLQQKHTKRRYMTLRWDRIALGALLSEVAIFAVVLPLNALRPSATYYAVPFLVTVAAFLFGRWVARPLAGAFVLHGVLTAVVASL